MPVFVLEIGSEELPARFLPGMEQELTTKFDDALKNAGMNYGKMVVNSTPRRAVVYIEDVAAETKLSDELVTGPPLKVAFDAAGKPTKAGEGFARTLGIDFSATFTIQNEKGEYLAARKKVGGENAMSLFSKICPEIISSLSFPKRMRWGSGEFTYARPLRWLLALLDTEVVPFSLAGMESGRTTCGHRIHGPGPFILADASGYFELLKNRGFVTPDAHERRKTILDGGNALADAAKGKVLWKDSLLDEVQGLCEHPVPMLASFEASFLEVPREVLLTSMESHQKSFGLESAEGELLPYFLTVLNISPKNEETVKRGWERVLRARLEDARFFWKSDLDASFESWLGKLDKVIFMAHLGSMGDKTRRLSALCQWLASQIGSVSGEDASRAGRLSKADLVTEMVGEFDTLQGIMGSIYALHKGENENVAQALAEQYLPAGPDSPVPSSLSGAILSIADKADTLVGCFGLGLIPTGAADPFALRRCALGITRILVEKKLRINVESLFSKAFELYGDKDWKLQPGEALEKLGDFFALRLKNYFTGHGAETLLAEAVIGAGYSDVWAAFARLEALKRFSSSADFESSVLTFKRAANIIRKQGQELGLKLDGQYDWSLLHEASEKELAEKLEKLLPSFEQLWVEDRFSELFDLLEQLKPSVDKFFNGVMVMCKEKDLRNNRLNLLQAMVDGLSRLADFDALQV